MSFNLIDAAKGLFANDLIARASSYLGESENGINKAIAGIIPSFLGGVTEKASSDEGASLVANAARESTSPGYLGSMGNIFDSNSGGFLSKGEGLLSNLFGAGKSGLLSGIISNFAGVKSSSASSLLSMAAPLILGLLGKHASGNNLDARGLSSFLNTQKSNISNAIPAGLNLDSFLGGMSSGAADTVSQVRHSAIKPSEVVNDAGTGAKILLPILLLVAVGAAIFWFTKDGCSKKTDTVITTTDTATDMTTDAVTSTVTTGAGKLDTATGDFIYDLGENVTLDLPNGGKLNVGRNSTEYKLVTFLNDKSAMIDTVKGNWFEFTNVRFNTGGSEITETSMDQLKNLVTISKAYPTAQFKIGGYTDNTGNAAANVTLSQKRAEAVAAMLKKLGIAGKAIESAKGYGQEWPLADNATPEGRAQNRRVAVNVKSR
jgi:outer membrane protein OmpA-like peptidoglycan-associated protein